MKVPINTKLYETDISIHWFDDDGIMCALSKPIERTVEEYKKVMGLYKKFIKGDQKLCLLTDTSNTMLINKEVREFIVSEMPKYIKAHAIISETPLEGSLTSAFIKLSWSGFPVKYFSDETEARDWLKDYL